LPAANAYQIEHDVLFQAIRRDREHNEAEYGAMSTMTAVMGRMAAYSGKEVHWGDADGSQLSLSPPSLAWDAQPPVVPDENGRYPVALPGTTRGW
jgi:hypothetical protein